MNNARQRRAGGVLASVALAAGMAAGISGAQAAPGPDFERAVVPLLKKYCYECHAEGVTKAGLALDEFKVVAEVREARKQFEGVLRAVTRHEMPPADAAEFPTA